MGAVAGCALAFGKRFMDLLILLGQILMTAKAVLGQIFIDQSLIAACMGSVAGAALSLSNRGMDDTFGKFFLTLLVTGVAESSLVIAQ